MEESHYSGNFPRQSGKDFTLSTLISPDGPLHWAPLVPGTESVEAAEALAGLVRLKLKGLEKQMLDAGFLYGDNSDQYKRAKKKYDEAFKKLWDDFQEGLEK